MSNLYQYITENYKENEPFFLSDIQIEGMTENNIRQQLKKLTDSEKVKRFDKGIYYLPQPSIFKSGARPTLERVLEYKYLCVKVIVVVISVDYYFSTSWGLLHRFQCNMRL